MKKIVILSSVILVIISIILIVMFQLVIKNNELEEKREEELTQLFIAQGYSAFISNTSDTPTSVEKYYSTVICYYYLGQDDITCTISNELDDIETIYIQKSISTGEQFVLIESNSGNTLTCDIDDISENSNNDCTKVLNKRTIDLNIMKTEFLSHVEIVEQILDKVD